MDLQQIGKILKSHRQRINLTSAEAANKLGVSPAYYSRLETGKERPSQDFLTKAAKFFELPVEDRMLVLQLAGYSGVGNPLTSNQSNAQVLIDPQKLNILYSDGAFISASENGVVFDFSQRTGPTDQQVVVSRVGVSYHHAKQIHKILGDQLKRAEDAGIEN